jgi:hypothetical protein
MVDCYYAAYKYIIVNTVSNLITYTINFNVIMNYEEAIVLSMLPLLVFIGRARPDSTLISASLRFS